MASVTPGSICVENARITGLSSIDKVVSLLMRGGRNVPTKCFGVCLFVFDSNSGMAKRLFHVDK